MTPCQFTVRNAIQPHIASRKFSSKAAATKPATSVQRAQRRSKKDAQKVDQESPGQGGESLLHFRTKQRLWLELKDQKSLSILKSCASRNDPLAPAIFPYWTCNNTKLEKNWIEGWNKAQMEYSVPSVGRFDLALVSESSNTPDKINGILEVLVTSPMTDSKVEQLKKRSLKWAEVQASVDFFRDDSTSTPASLRPNSGWKHEQPLPVIGTSDGPWICDACKERKAEEIKFNWIGAVVDVYLSATTYHGRGQIKRKVFGIYEKHTPRRWEKPHQAASTEFFLVEGSQLLTTTRLGMDVLPLESKLLASIAVKETIDYSSLSETSDATRSGKAPRATKSKTKESPSPSSPTASSKIVNATTTVATSPNIKPPFKDFQRLVIQELEREKKMDDGALIDVRVDWPGTDLESFFSSADQSLGALVSIQGIKSLGKLHASLARIVGYRYRFHPHEGIWIPSRNHGGL